MNSEAPRRALLFSAGGELGPFHIGAAKVLLTDNSYGAHKGREYALFGGVSVGAFIAAFLAQYPPHQQGGPGIEDLEAAFASLPALDDSCAACRLSCLLLPCGTCGCTGPNGPRGFWDGARLREVVRQTIDFGRIQASGVGLVFTATCAEDMGAIHFVNDSALRQFEECTGGEGGLRDPEDALSGPGETRLLENEAHFEHALVASMSMPLAFPPTRRTPYAERLVDGGLTHQIPPLCMPGVCVDCVLCAPHDVGLYYRPLSTASAMQTYYVGVQGVRATRDAGDVGACSSCPAGPPKDRAITVRASRRDSTRPDAYEVQPLTGMARPNAELIKEGIAAAHTALRQAQRQPRRAA